MEYSIIMTTTESAADAQRIAEQVISRRLAACVQVVGPVQSTYRWQGKVESAVEYRCEIKTASDRFADVEHLIAEIHPYDVPEIVAVPIGQLEGAYANWMRQQLG